MVSALLCPPIVEITLAGLGTPAPAVALFMAPAGGGLKHYVVPYLYWLGMLCAHTECCVLYCFNAL
ncbi:MAG: hypothetical protein HGA19_01640 [Oscillochloris sp.]|nr:hypothetical protein [Oscillochloris sp.]